MHQIEIVGTMKQIFDFLKELDANNNREWFQDNKNKYLEAKALFEEFVGELIKGLSRFDPEISGVAVKDCVFRIYRDLRFSPDKRPYKIYMGAYMCKGGKCSPYGGYYVHMQPGESFFAGGVYDADPKLIKVIRKEIYGTIEEFKAIVEDAEFTRYYSLFGEKLKKVPADFPSDYPDGEWLKYKHYSPASFVDETFFEGSDVVERCVERLTLLLPINRYLNYSVDEWKEVTGKR